MDTLLKIGLVGLTAVAVHRVLACEAKTRLSKQPMVERADEVDPMTRLLEHGEHSGEPHHIK